MEPERSSNADSLWNTNPDLHLNEILNNIKAGASRGAAGGPSLSYMMAPFAVLLVRLSRDAEERSNSAEVTARAVNEKTQTLITLTRRLIILTVALIALTVPLVLIETTKFISEVFQFPLHKPEHANHTEKNNQQPETAKKPDDAPPASVVEPVNKPPVEAVATPTIEGSKEKKE